MARQVRLFEWRAQSNDRFYVDMSFESPFGSITVYVTGGWAGGLCLWSVLSKTKSATGACASGRGYRTSGCARGVPHVKVPGGI